MSNNICEEKVFQSVYQAQVVSLRNFLYYKSGDIELANDLVQDAFLKLWEYCAKVSLEKAKSFVFTIANNLFLNSVKHKSVVLKFEQVSRPGDNIEDAQFQLEQKEFQARLEKAISALPEDQRVVFLMNRIDKKKYREIADELGLSIKAVEKRMHKALKAMRKIHHKL